jgi:hypothetical protein
MKFALLISSLLLASLAIGQSLQVIAVDVSNAGRTPSTIHFYCSKDYDRGQCKSDVAGLQQLLSQFPLIQLGEWSIVLATRQETRRLQHAEGDSAETPALTYLKHRISIFEGDLLSADAQRTSELLQMYGRNSIDLRLWAVSHELGHALCQESDEHRAEDYGRQLRNGVALHCGASGQLQSAAR